MPTYEYRCAKCGVHYLEERTLSEGSEPDDCEGCGTRLIRLYNFSAVSFNGSGFYSTDK